MKNARFLSTNQETILDIGVYSDETQISTSFQEENEFGSIIQGRPSHGENEAEIFILAI